MSRALQAVAFRRVQGINPGPSSFTFGSLSFIYFEARTYFKGDIRPQGTAYRGQIFSKV